MARTLTSVTAEDVKPYATALRKAAAESGWDETTQRLLLLRFIAGVDAARGATPEDFADFLKAASEDEAVNILGRPTRPIYHGEQAVDEAEDEEDEEDEEDDFDDDLDDDFDDDLDDEDDDEDDDDDDFTDAE